MAPRTRVPVLLLTGFLGSGKTSLLARWLRAPDFAGAMVIVNELGEVGLDDRLVQTSSDAPLLLDNGCVCCTANEDLVGTLERLFWDRLHRKIPKFDWVLIETTGIAEPAPIVASIEGHDLVSERYVVAGVVTTVDARRGVAQMAEHPECLRQMQGASLIVLTKVDIATPHEIAAARRAIADIRPDASVFDSARGDLPASTLVAALRQAAAPQPEACVAEACTHDGHDHSHHHAHNAGEVTTSFAPLDAPVAFAALEGAIAGVQAAYGGALLRVKGAARTGAGDAINIIQAMVGEPVERTPYVAPPGAQPIRTGLTIIARQTPAQAMADYFNALLSHAERPTA